MVTRFRTGMTADGLHHFPALSKPGPDGLAELTGSTEVELPLPLLKASFSTPVPFSPKSESITVREMDSGYLHITGWI
jgi:hypothetical protein